MVCNPDYQYTKTFDSLKWFTESVDSDNINQFKDTFSELSMYNDYQHTGDRELYYQHDSAPGGTYTDIPLARRERTWSMQIPRNIVDADVDTNPDITDSANWTETGIYFKDRMRDKYLTCKFTYDNSTQNVFSIPFISCVYRKSTR